MCPLHKSGGAWKGGKLIVRESRSSSFDQSFGSPGRIEEDVLNHSGSERTGNHSPFSGEAVVFHREHTGCTLSFMLSRCVEVELINPQIFGNRFDQPARRSPPHLFQHHVPRWRQSGPGWIFRSGAVPVVPAWYDAHAFSSQCLNHGSTNSFSRSSKALVCSPKRTPLWACPSFV